MGRLVHDGEVRGICEAGGEVTGADRKVWCVREDVFGHLFRGCESMFNAFHEGEDVAEGPFTVTKEPPAREAEAKERDDG